MEEKTPAAYFFKETIWVKGETTKTVGASCLYTDIRHTRIFHSSPRISTLDRDFPPPPAAG